MARRTTTRAVRGPTSRDPHASFPTDGLLVRLRLVAPGPGRASGVFESVGAIAGSGTARTDPFVPSAPRDDTRPVHVDGVVRMSGSAGELAATIAAIVRPVPGTSVLHGGGTWLVTRSRGTYDGLRAAGAVTLVITYDRDDAATLELLLTGRVPAGRSTPDCPSPGS